MTRKEQRRFRQGLISFFETVSFFLLSGYELSYGWRAALEGLKDDLPMRLQKELGHEILLQGGDFGEALERLVSSYPEKDHRIWFQSLREIYVSGSPVYPAVKAIARALGREQSRDVEAFCRELPTRMNVALILFFLPPTFLLLFTPLLIDIMSKF